MNGKKLTREEAEIMLANDIVDSMDMKGLIQYAVEQISSYFKYIPNEDFYIEWDNFYEDLELEII